jgi:type II secretory pathway pseudopilin PulG
MKLKTVRRPIRARKSGLRAFTLAEVLAAMLFMAIVIPVAIQGLRIASLAGEVATRKLVAARIGNEKLNELKVMNQLQNSSQSGTVTENGLQYKWSVRSQGWAEDPNVPMTQVTMTVTYPAQGKNFDVKLTTLLPQAGVL